MVIRAVSLILVMIISTSCTSRSTRSQTRQSHDSQRLFTANGHQFQPLIAHDDDDRARGLQYRQPPADGLILLFPRSSRQSIWMPNCPVDLEGWIIDDRGTLLEILELPAEPEQRTTESLFQYHARLPRHRAINSSRIVWEFKAGTAAGLDLHPGQTIDGDWSSVLQMDRQFSAAQ